MDCWQPVYCNLNLGKLQTDKNLRRKERRFQNINSLLSLSMSVSIFSISANTTGHHIFFVPLETVVHRRWRYCFFLAIFRRICPKMLSSEPTVYFSSSFFPCYWQDLTKTLWHVWYGLVGILWWKWPKMLTFEPTIGFRSSFFLLYWQDLT